MRTGDAITALINRTSAALIACGYKVCNTERTAVNVKVPCCQGDGCATWTITGGVRKHTPTPAGSKQNCSYIPTYQVELIVARCYSAATDSLVPDDDVGGQALDVLDCLAAVWACDSERALGFFGLDFVSAERVDHGVCLGWRILLNAQWLGE